MMHAYSPWIKSPLIDSAFILSPPFIAAATSLALVKGGINEIEPWMWLLLVVGIDVAHVYSTLFRTYLDREELRRRPLLYVLAPVLSFVVGAMLYSFNSLIFWRALAYLAAFHFVRQAYGFFSIYSRVNSPDQNRFRKLDIAAIYLSTVSPLIFWHFNGAREFKWFIENDFLIFNLPIVSTIVFCLMGLVFGAYAIKEAWLLKLGHKFNWPKNFVLLGTAVSWGVGIVLFDSDLVFTLTNIVAHGIPYTALIWIHEKRRLTSRPVGWWTSLFSAKLIPAYIGVLLLFGYLEEALWDALIWKDHATLFPLSGYVPEINDKTFLALLVPLLALPQATHYVLDGFIWRSDKRMSGTLPQTSDLSIEKAG